MQDEQLENLILKAQAHDETAREKLLEDFRPFAVEVASRLCKRRLEFENDDELSIALVALNQAIDSYDALQGKQFKNYAALIIKSRLIDYFRKEGRHFHHSLDAADAEHQELRQWETHHAWIKYQDEQSRLEWAEEIVHFEQRLQTFGISMQKLERIAPKHQDTREKLLEVAQHISSRKDMVLYIHSTKRLPMKEIVSSCNVSKKALKRGRQYIIALFLILTEEDFSHFRSLFDLEHQKTAAQNKNYYGISKGGSPNGKI